MTLNYRTKFRLLLNKNILASTRRMTCQLRERKDLSNSKLALLIPEQASAMRVSKSFLLTSVSLMRTRIGTARVPDSDYPFVEILLSRWEGLSMFKVSLAKAHSSELTSKCSQSHKRSKSFPNKIWACSAYSQSLALFSSKNNMISLR